jgi:hypothetical protein
VFRLFLHPDLINFDEPVTVTVNGCTLFDAKVTPDIGFLMRNFLEHRDFGRIFVAELVLDAAMAEMPDHSGKPSPTATAHP